MSPALSRSLALQHVKLSDALEIREGIIFDFYPGLPHMYVAYICCMTQVNQANVTGRDHTCCWVTLCLGKKVEVEERNGGRKARWLVERQSDMIPLSRLDLKTMGL